MIDRTEIEAVAGRFGRSAAGIQISGTKPRRNIKV
jgi:hypothetical protein